MSNDSPEQLVVTRKQALEQLQNVARVQISVLQAALGPERRMMAPPTATEMLSMIMDTLGLVCMMTTYVIDAELRYETDREAYIAHLRAKHESEKH